LFLKAKFLTCALQCDSKMIASQKIVTATNFTFNFNFKHLLFGVLLFVGLYFLSQYVVINQSISTSVSYSYEEVAALAEEIYSSGEISDAVNNLPLEASILAKLISELERILQKTTDYPGCELYYLRAKATSIYPVLGYGNQILGAVKLNKGEVWKVGQTCNGEKERYSSNTYYKNTSFSLTIDELEYVIVTEGSYKQILIMEKLMIYTYPFWSGHLELPKPPGCKIYR